VTRKWAVAVAALCACLLAAAQTEAPKSIWPSAGSSQWFWIVPRTDLAPEEIEAVFKRVTAEQTAYLDAKFPVTLFNALKFRLTAGKARKGKEDAGQPGKSGDLRIEAEWRNGYLDQYRGRSYTYIPLDAIRSIDLHFLPLPRERFPKAPLGRNWNVNILAESLYSFFFAMEDTARAFINAVAASVKQRDLPLDFSRFGLMWENVTHAQSVDMGRPDSGGVLVTRVAFGGPADRAGIQPLDAVLEVNGVAVKNFSHFSLLLKGLLPGTKASLLLLRRLRPPERDPEPRHWETLTLELEAR
jgi:hypothetical protein